VPTDIGYNGEYPFPSQAIALEKVEVSYNGTDYIKADIINNSDVDSSQFSADDIAATYSEQDPKIFIYRDSYFVRPLNNVDTVTNGLKLFIRGRQSALVAPSDVPLFEENLHKLIPLKVAQDYAIIYPEKANSKIDAKIMVLEAQLISLYESRTPIESQFKSPKQDRGLRNW
jgi:hypothetical protein